MAFEFFNETEKYGCTSVISLFNEGGVRGVRKPQNRTEIRQKTAKRIGFFPECRNRTSSLLSVATSTTSVAIVAHWIKAARTREVVRLYELTFHEVDASLAKTVNHSKNWLEKAVIANHTNKPWCVVKQSTYLALAQQQDADRSKECHHRRHLFFHRKPRPEGCNNR